MEALLGSPSAVLQILKRSGRVVSHVFRISLDEYPGSVLFLGALGRPMTAWVWKHAEKSSLILIIEEGFPASPRKKPEDAL